MTAITLCLQIVWSLSEIQCYMVCLINNLTYFDSLDYAVSIKIRRSYVVTFEEESHSTLLVGSQKYEVLPSFKLLAS